MGFLTRCLMRRPLIVSYLRRAQSCNQCLVTKRSSTAVGGERTRTPPPRAVAAPLCCSTLPASRIALRPRSRRPSPPATLACRLRAALAPAPPSRLRALRLWLRLRLDSPGLRSLLRTPVPLRRSGRSGLPGTALRPSSGLPVAAPGPQLPDAVCVVSISPPAPSPSHQLRRPPAGFVLPAAGPPQPLDLLCFGPADCRQGRRRVVHCIHTA